MAYLSLCGVTGLLSQQQSSQGFIHLRQVSVFDQQPLKNIEAWTRRAGALVRTRMGSKVVWHVTNVHQHNITERFQRVIHIKMVLDFMYP